MHPIQIWRALLLVLLLESFPSGSFGQSPTLNQLDPLNPNASGLRIADVMVSSSYSSESFSGASGSGFPSSSASASMVEASATVAWSKSGDRSTFSVLYSPSYFREFQSNYHSFNQSISVMGTRKLISGLTLATSFQGLVADFNQLLFAPSLFDGLSATSSSFDELASAILTGQSGNPGLTQLLGAAPVNGSPQNAFLYGGRELNASAMISLIYTSSTRSSFHLSMQAMRTQFLRTGSNGSTIGPTGLIPASTMGSANLGWSFSSTPRTTVGVDVSSSRVFSRFEDAYTTQVAASIGHTLNTRWFMQAMFGAGYITPVRETFAQPQSAEPVFGASIGYKFKAQTLLGSYARSASDTYGLGASATQSGTGAWTWNRTGSSISLSSGFGYTYLSGQAFPKTSSWTAHVSISKRLAPQLAVSATYSYVQFPEALLARATNLTVTGVMAGLSWSPSARR
jgi:hypothetical protein